MYYVVFLCGSEYTTNVSLTLTAPVPSTTGAFLFYMIEEKVKEIVEYISLLGLNDKVDMLNYIRRELHNISPFKNEPVDLVQWVLCEQVHANDYNPNKVAPPEMELL